MVGLANLAIDAGEPSRATEMLDDLLAMTPATSLTQRADALELLTRARAALGDEAQTRSAAAALQEIATAIPTKPLQAMASVARPSPG